MMVTASAIGVASVTGGLILSYHYDTAAGATMAGLAVLVFFVVLLATEVAAAVGTATSGATAP